MIKILKITKGPPIDYGYLKVKGFIIVEYKRSFDEKLWSGPYMITFTSYKKYLAWRKAG